MLAHTPRSNTVLLAGTHIPAQEVRLRPYVFAREMMAARSRFGSALCECQSPGLRLQIRERSGKLHLAAWPGQAGDHAFHCPFYGEHERAKSVVGIASSVDGRTSVQYASPMTSQAGAQREHKSQPKEGTARMWALLHHLWQGAGLNRWYPGWRRDWGLARHLLLREASEVEIEDTTLDHILYIPRVFTDKAKAEIDQQWHGFVRSLATHCRGQSEVRSAFVLGVVRTLTQTQYGYQVTLQQHAPSILIPENICRSLSHRSRRGWSEAILMDGRKKDLRAKVIVMLRVEALRSGNLIAVDAVMMRTTKALIPSNSGLEDELASALQEAGSEFIRPLSFEQRQGELPHFILRQQEGQGAFLTDMYCIPLSTPSHSVDQIILTRATKAIEAGHGIWYWDRHQGPTIPKLPLNVNVIAP